MVNPGIRAELAIYIRREREINEELTKLQEEIPVWKRRVDLASEKGMAELANQAQERVDQLLAKRQSLRREIDAIEEKKRGLRYEARRPSGASVRRAEAMVEGAIQAGLIRDEDSLEAKLERLARERGDDDVVLDFDE